MKAELLAPAGSFEALEAAIGAGADAVYVGGDLFGARAYARNFTGEELKKAIDYVHLHQKKLYLTVNTLIKDKEMEEMLYEYLYPLYIHGLDAVIVQDLGVFQWIHMHFPDLPIHASTQMTITGVYGAKMLKEMGASRVVTARELSLEELHDIHEQVDIEIESFVHGALCYSYSGQCLFSSILGGRSGNRGRCAQPCRLPYEVVNGKKSLTGSKECYPLSPKDICTIDLLPEILASGVYSLKIEGRMKQPSYVAGVVSIYRKYLDLYEADPAHYKVEKQDRQQLLDVFNRGGFSSGYYKTQNGPEMIAFTTEKKVGDHQVKITKRKEKIKGNFIIFPEKNAILEVHSQGKHVRLEGQMAHYAKGQPLTEDKLRKQLLKTGDTPFVFDELKIRVGEGVFFPLGAVNEMRREALQHLEEEILSSYRRIPVKEQFPVFYTIESKYSDELPIYASCENAAQMQILLEEKDLKGIFVPIRLAQECLAQKKFSQMEVYVSLPHITRSRQMPALLKSCDRLMECGIHGFLVRNLECYRGLKSHGYEKHCILDNSLYTMNHCAMEFWQNEGVLADTIPWELNEKELKKRRNEGSHMIVYGRIPLMLTAQCVQKNLDICTKREDILYLKDRYQKVFPVKCCCEECYNIIYNSLPMGLLKEADNVKELKPKAIRLSFTLESGKETKAILKEFIQVYQHKGIPGDWNFTKGHFRRGVE